MSMLDKIKKLNDVHYITTVLQGYDRQYITKEQVSKFFKIDFETGEIEKNSILYAQSTKTDIVQFLFQMADKQLISKEIVTKLIFGVEKTNNCKCEKDCETRQCAIYFKKLDTEAKIPTRKNPTDAGLDLYALEDVIIKPNTYEIVKTGITFEFIKNTVMFLWPKSKSIMLVGAGVIDDSFQGPILAKLFNVLKEDFVIKKHDPIAQMVIVPVLYPELVEDNNIHQNETARGGTGGIVEQNDNIHEYHNPILKNKKYYNG